MWWLRRSTRMTSASHRFRARAAAIPANPAPTITMRLRPTSGGLGVFALSLTRSRVAPAPGCRMSWRMSVMLAFSLTAMRDSEYLGRASGSLVTRSERFIFPAQLEQSQQDFVALRLELGDRARAHLFVYAIDQLAADPHR